MTFTRQKNGKLDKQAIVDWLDGVDKLIYTGPIVLTMAYKYVQDKNGSKTDKNFDAYYAETLCYHTSISPMITLLHWLWKSSTLVLYKIVPDFHRVASRFRTSPDWVMWKSGTSVYWCLSSTRLSTTYHGVVYSIVLTESNAGNIWQSISWYYVKYFQHYTVKFHDFLKRIWTIFVRFH